FNYSPENLPPKKRNKQLLLEGFGLDADEDRPLVGMVTRLVDQKGMDLVAEAMEDMMALDLNFILLGTGDETYHELARSWAERWPERCAVILDFDRGLSHRIEGGADLFLMPSRFEPCGLNQLYSLKYGTVPIVHAVGGLDDTIDDIPNDGTAGTGFKMTEYTVEALLEALKQALSLYENRKLWDAIRKRGMKQDFSWNASAEAYSELYRSLLRVEV
ncbi:MAG: glycosyltransferase, partial [Verrucomicrobiota bacterium]